MSDEKDELDKLEEHVDKVLSPDRAMRWMVRFVVLAIVVGVAFTLGRIAFHLLGKVDKAVDEVEQQEQKAQQEAAAAKERAALDHNWFVLKKDAIDAATIEVRTRIGDLARHKVKVENRPMLSFTGKEDRTEAARLEGRIAEANRTRLALIRDYNEKAAGVGPAVLGDLPQHLEVVEVRVSDTGEHLDDLEEKD